VRVVVILFATISSNGAAVLIGGTSSVAPSSFITTISGALSAMGLNTLPIGRKA
jgi:hypothetical protein